MDALQDRLIRTKLSEIRTLSASMLGVLAPRIIYPSTPRTDSSHLTMSVARLTIQFKLYDTGIPNSVIVSFDGHIRFDAFYGARLYMYGGMIAIARGRSDVLSMVSSAGMPHERGFARDYDGSHETRAVSECAPTAGCQ